MRPKSDSPKRRWLLWITLAAVGIAAYLPAKRSVAALRMMSMTQRVAAGDIDKLPAVRETVVVRRAGSAEFTAITYCPVGADPSDGVIIVPGVSELGAHHPRLVSLSRALAKSGIFVMTPDIPMLREFRIYPPPMVEISFWIHEARLVPGGRRMRRLGLAGISFSGTLALIAAAQPVNRGHVAFVLGIGCFDDLSRCSRFWFEAGPVTVGPGYYPTRYYARWVIMLAALDLLTDADDRRFLKTALNDLLLQKEVLPPRAGVSPEGIRWYRLATMPEDQSDPALADQIESHVGKYICPLLDTNQATRDISCPVFLAHGAYDDLIPPEESRILQGKIRQAKSYLLITPFLTHTHPWEKPMGWATKTAAFLRLFVFFYHLAAVL